MAKILLGNPPLSLWELDDFSKAMLPALCRNLGLSYLEDDEGNLILEPPLGNKTIVLRPLPGPDKGFNTLLTSVSQKLQGLGANVLILPATARDGRLFRLWQTQVLFAFSQKDTSGIEPGLRFFYALKKRDESLGLIASLVRAMLTSENPPCYSIPGPWEHFKNFRYYHLLNNAGVPSVLIEFCQVELDAAFINNLTVWLVNGLTEYFREPLDEDTVVKLQAMLSGWRDTFLQSRPSKERPSATGRSAAKLEDPLPAEEKITPRDATIDIAGEGTVQDDATPAGINAGVAGEPPEVPVIPEEQEKSESAPEKLTIATAETVKEGQDLPEAEETTINEPALPSSSETEEVPARISSKSKGQPETPSLGASQLEPENATAKPAPVQSRSETSPLATATTGSPAPEPGLVPVTETLPGRPEALTPRTKSRHRGNTFVPPGDGPVFIFQRPTELASFPSPFPQEVLERMPPAAVQSTFNTTIPSIKPEASTIFARQEPQPVPPDLPLFNPEPAKPQPPAGGSDTTLVELKNLSSAILAQEQLQEPQNGEAPSI